MPVLNGSAAGRVITRYKTYTSYNVLHLVIRIFVTVNFFASDVPQSSVSGLHGHLNYNPPEIVYDSRNPWLIVDVKNLRRSAKKGPSMRFSRYAALVVAALICVLSGRVLAQPMTIAFTNANVIPLDHNGVEQGWTVLVRGDRIAEVGSRYEVKVPSDAAVIDCTEQYLVPGLTDAHVHVSGSPVVPTRDDFGDAPIYLAYGVTTVVNLSGSPTILEWRKKVEAGTLLGPTIYTAGPFVNEPRVNTPDEVERDIVAQAQLGYDLIKF